MDLFTRSVADGKTLFDFGLAILVVDSILIIASCS